MPSRLACFGKGFRGRGRLASLPWEQEGGLVDEDSDEPALEGTFALEVWPAAKGCAMTVPDCGFGCIDGGEDAACDEMKHLATVQELLIEGVFVKFTIDFEMANIWNADALIAFRNGGNWFTGSVSHEHDFLSVVWLSLLYARVYAWIQGSYICRIRQGAGTAVERDQMMRPDEKTRPKWCNDKLKRAKGTTGRIPVRKPSRAGEDTFDRAVEFPDEGVDHSSVKGLAV